MLGKRKVKVRLLVSRVGNYGPKHTRVFSQKFGDVIEVTKSEAKRMIEAGQATENLERRKQTKKSQLKLTEN